MSIYIPNSNDVKKILNYIDDAEKFLEKTILNVKSSMDNIPSPIKNKILENYNNLITELNDIKKDCEYTVTGINNNIQAYEAPSYTKESIGSPGAQNPGFQYTTSGDLMLANKSFFESLSNKGKGSFDAEKGVYTLGLYEYNVNNGKLTVNGNKSQVVFGIYVPENASNLSNLNTITFLHGDAKFGVKFTKDEDMVMPLIDKCPADTILIFPQANTDRTGKGFIPYSNDVVAGTEFVKELTSQKSSQQNALIGFSSGFKSTYEIAANEGKNTYDTVVGINGYVEQLDDSEIKNLKDKQLYMYVASDECTGDPWAKRMDSLDTVYNSGLNPKIITGSQEYMQKAVSKGFDTTFIEDKNFKGHGKGCQYAISNLNALHCFKG